DHSAGAHAALATLAALHQRRRTGLAQHVDLAAREVASAMIGDALVLASLGEVPARPGNADPGMAPYGVYPTSRADRWLTIAVRDDAQWRALARALGQEADDPRFAAAADRLRRREELDVLLGQWLAGCDADATAQRLQQAGVSAHVSWSMQDIASDRHLRARRATVEVRAPDLEPRLAVGAPGRFSRTDDVGIRRLTPALGQDEDYVFGELLGLSSAQRADLEAREIIL
ncbi:MAG TPA: CoA transferase, partial [Bordetella sp.]